MKKFGALLTKEKEEMVMNEWENDDSNILRVLCSISKKS